MIITNVTGAYFLKQNDTATQIRLLISEVDGTPVDLSLASKVEVVIGVPEGRVLVKTPKLLPEVGELEFGLDEGDIVPTGDDLLEVHIYNMANEKRVAPSKGYYKLKVQKPIDELEAEVTTYTLDYFLGEVNRITAGLPEIMVRTEVLADRMDVLIVDSETALTQSEQALANAEQSEQLAQEAFEKAETAIQDASNATSAAINAADAANQAMTDAQGATTAADSAANRADTAAGLIEGWTGAVTWTAGFYNKNNVVVHEGNTYQARRNSVASVPPMPAVTNEDWIVLALKGAKGDTGTGLNIKGAVNGVSELPLVGQDGDAYIVNTVENGESKGILYVWNATVQQWQNSGNIKGEKGDTGANGNDGKSAYQAAIDNGYIGTESEWIMSLKGEKGDQGLAGNDADVTKENIESALGYTPANQTAVGSLGQTVVRIDNNLTTLDNKVTTHLDETSQVATFGASVNQSIASGVDTSIVFSTTKGYNNSNLALIDNGKIKVLKKGVYHLEASIGIMYEEARVGFRSLAVEGNVAKQVPMPSTPNNLNVYKTIFIGSDNYTLSIETFQNSGLALDALSYATKVTLRKVADLL